jgi:hypothetical protein
MKTKGLIMTVAIGMLVSMPAHAWTWNSATYASRFRPAQPAPTTTANSKATPGNATSEIQVAVMAKSPSQSSANNSGGDIWHGSDQRSHATHSH